METRGFKRKKARRHPVSSSPRKWNRCEAVAMFATCGTLREKTATFVLRADGARRGALREGMTTLAASQVWSVRRGTRGGAAVSTRRFRRASYGQLLTEAKTARRDRRVVDGFRVIVAKAKASRDGTSRDTTDPSPARAVSGSSASTSESPAPAPAVFVEKPGLDPRDPLPVARAELLLVPLLWATYNPAMRFVYESNAPPSPAELTAVRMLIALVPFSVVLANIHWGGGGGEGITEGSDASTNASDEKNTFLKKADTALLLTAGCELGFLNAAGTACQAFGLELTSATRAGFLLSTINVLVPVFAVAGGAKITPVVFGSVLLASFGVCVSEDLFRGLDFETSFVGFGDGALEALGTYANPESFEALAFANPQSLEALAFASPNLENLPSSGSTQGDLCCLAASVLYSAFTVRLSLYAKKCAPDELSAVKALCMTVLCVSWWGVDTVIHSAGGLTGGIEAVAAGSGVGSQSTSVLWSSFASAASTDASSVSNGVFEISLGAAVWTAVVYSALAPGALANVLQTRGQAVVPPEQAQLIFATTPVFNAVVSSLVLGETATINTLVGGSIICAASVAPFLVRPKV